ncbi:MAG: phosphoethanolamine--lipid A transferase [Jannaschia sp.]
MPETLTNPFPHLRAMRDTEISAISLSAVVAAVLMVGYNATYWSKALSIFDGHPVQLVLFNLAVYGLTLAFFAWFSLRLLVRPFLAGMLIVTAVTSYYMDTLGVVIDRDMIQNVASTTFTEGKHLLTPGFLIHVLLFGILPAAVVMAVRVRRHRWFGALGRAVALFVFGLALGVGMLLTNYGSYASVLRERKDFMSSFQPGAPIVATVRYAKMMMRTVHTEVAAIGLDARKGATHAGARKPLLTVIFAGETARAQQFSLNGYDKPTNPELAQRPVINFSDTSSCGTATAVSLPCMFSPYARADYTYDRGVSTESLLDVLVQAGFAVEWWDNNTGDKGVAARVPVTVLTNTENAEFCPTGECMDGIFLERLADFLPTITEDTVLVLHMIGSHGPSYSLRYPAGWGPFGPACETSEFKDCSAEEIINAYDNTIAYTDHVLAQTIDMLGAQPGLATAMVYVSDHGESLGEAGLYLHGAPYFMAPDFQTRVPMILWMSDLFKTRLALDGDCIADKADDATSHDNLFHSVLGLLDVETAIRDVSLDLFGTCRAERVADAEGAQPGQGETGDLLR